MSVSLAEAARRVGVTRGLLSRWVASGDLVPVGRRGVAFLVDVDDVARLAAARRAPTPRVPLPPLLARGGWRFEPAAGDRRGGGRSGFIHAARCSAATLREWESHGVPVWAADRLAVRLLNRTAVEVWGAEWESAWPDEATA